MQCEIGDVGEEYVCLYIDGLNFAEMAFIELLMSSKLTKYQLSRNAANTFTLSFTKPPKKQRKSAKLRTIAKGKKQIKS